MRTCFVIQPFDEGGPFDKRFDEVLAPAIDTAGFEPYRVDRDPRVSIPIEEIENGIRSSAICLADITIDNPNVWFELGYAIAVGKEVVMICSASRTSKFPFDVQHRTIIRYSVDSPGDFNALEGRIADRIRAVVEKGENLANVAQSPLSDVEGLSHHELITIASVAGNLTVPDGAVFASTVHRDVEQNGFTQLASVLGLRGLVQKGFIEEATVYDEQSGDGYSGYKMAEAGWSWITSNEDKFSMRRRSTLSDDIPF